METIASIECFLPELVLVGALVFLFISDALFPKIRENFFPLGVILGACLLGVLVTVNLSCHSAARPFFSGLVVQDKLTHFFRYLFFFAGAVGAYLGFGSRELKDSSRLEFSLLLLCVVFGLCLMAMANNLLILYLGLETVSIVSFVMAGFRRQDNKSNEAAFKYLVYGSLASGLMIYGFSLLYGLTGSLQYNVIGSYLAQHGAETPLVLGLCFCLTYAGLAYKISAFPMHFWTPDVYEGSPTPVTAFFSIGPKAAGLCAFIRVALYVFSPKTETGQWQGLPGLPLASWVAAASACTMLVGNLSALGQTSVKRILAFSSIAHVGYMLMGFVVLGMSGLSSVLFYLVVYCAMNVGAFWVVCVVENLKDSDDLAAFRGMGWQMPTLGVCMAIFLFSLTGIPLFAGFVGKFLLFNAVLKTPGFLWLAVVAVLNSVVSLFYYLKILKAMWLEGEKDSVVFRLSLYDRIGMVALAIPTIVFGLFFTPLIQFTESALFSLL